MKKKIMSAFLLGAFMLAYGCNVTLAIQEKAGAGKAPQSVQLSPNAKPIEFAFVFDGPSDKNTQILKTFQKEITKSLAPDFKPVFNEKNIFVGDWTENGVKSASDKALNSSARTVISTGYLSSVYLEKKTNTSKFIITIDEYGLREFGSSDFFNPLKQYVNDFILFKKLVPTQHKTAILLNESFYKLQKDWNNIIKQKFAEKNCDLDFVVLSISEKNFMDTIKKIPSDVDSVYVTPLFNLSVEERKEMYNYLSNQKLPTFSALGKEDVELGAMLGTSTPDTDRKIAEAVSFNIHGYLHGNAVKNQKISFYDDKVIFYNKDTGEIVGYRAPLRLLNNCEIISYKEAPKYDLTYVFNKMEESNLDIAQKKFLVDAARRATVGAYLRYLPTLRIDLGYQSYNDDYAKSYTNVPTHVGQFVLAMDQVIYSPDLVTNIIVKHKKLKFDKAEKVLTEQQMGLQVGFLYLDTLMLENMIKVQQERLAETRENLAIARVREAKGLCGPEEALRWAGLVSEDEKKLLGMKAEYKNVKVQINKLLFKDQKEDYTFAPLVSHDPAFFTSDIHILDHVRTPEKLEKFTDMLVEEVQYLSPETVKLKAAIAMKKAEMSNYAQKFIMPNAKLSLEYGSQFDRSLPFEYIGHRQLSAYPAPIGTPWLNLDKTSGRVLIAAQWKPIEGGYKFAEIARCKAELNQLNAYLTEVNTALEMTIREVVNRAISKYFMIEKSYKAMFAEAESYQRVKARYLMGEAPITQLSDAQDLYTQAKVDALNSQYDFYKELFWVQRGLVSINWTKASKEAKDFINHIPEVLPAEPDFTL